MALAKQSSKFLPSIKAAWTNSRGKSSPLLDCHHLARPARDDAVQLTREVVADFELGCDVARGRHGANL